MIAGLIASGLTKLQAFVDAFTRGDNGSTLQAAGTKAWINKIGTWGIATNRASTATAASSYPIATVNTGSRDATTKIGFGANNTYHGWGTVFWLLDAANWYASYTDRTYYLGGPFYSLGCPTYPYTQGPFGAQNWCGSVNCTGGSGPLAYFHPCDGVVPGTWNGEACVGGNPGTCQNICGGGCYFTGPPCDDTTEQCHNDNHIDAVLVEYYTNNYVYWLRTIRSLASVVSTINSTTYVTSENNTRYTDFVQVKTNFPSADSVRVSYQPNGGSVATFDVAITAPIQGKSYGVLVAPITTGTNQPTQATTVDDYEYTPT